MGSLEIMEWLREGANVGDPIRGPLYVVTFVVGGLVSALFGGGVI
ncbi:hypothetical protein [Rhodococcus oryzae]